MLCVCYARIRITTESYKRDHKYITVTGAYASNCPSVSIFARKKSESHIINEIMISVSLKGCKEQK